MSEPRMHSTIIVNPEPEVREVDREIAATLSSGEFAPGLAEKIIAKHMAPERARAKRVEEAARELLRVLDSYGPPEKNLRAIAALDAALEEK